MAMSDNAASKKQGIAALCKGTMLQQCGMKHALKQLWIIQNVVWQTWDA